MLTLACGLLIKPIGRLNKSFLEPLRGSWYHKFALALKCVLNLIIYLSCWLVLSWKRALLQVFYNMRCSDQLITPSKPPIQRQFLFSQGLTLTRLCSECVSEEFCKHFRSFFKSGHRRITLGCPLVGGVAYTRPPHTETKCNVHLD